MRDGSILALNWTKELGPRWAAILTLLIWLVIGVGLVGGLIKNRHVGCGLTIAVLLIVMAVFRLLELPPASADKNKAWDLARRYVEQTLEGSSTVQYGSQAAGECVKEPTKDQFRVDGWVEHEKSGRMIREQFRVDLVCLDGSWKLKNVWVGLPSK